MMITKDDDKGDDKKLKDQFSLTETFKGKSETFYEILKNSLRAWFGSKHQGFLTVNWDRIINKRHR